jgi:hypothetical protein
VFLAPPAEPAPPRYGLALTLLALTFFTTTTLGPLLAAWSQEGLPADVFPLVTPRLVAQVWGDPAVLRLGLSFSLPVLTILLVHELGHYLACRRYRLAATLPYFLPLPMVLGTLGAFIRIRQPFRGKRELFDVGVAGPLAGFAALLPFLFIGIARSHPEPLTLAAGASRLLPGSCLAMQLATLLFHGRLPPGTMLSLHPFALAAWFGLLATAINLLPLGQLDGGHVLYAVAGRWQRRLALPLWVALALAGMLWGGWVLWCVAIFIMGLRHPPVIDEATPLDRRRRILAGIALAVFVLSFTPYGANEIASDEPPPPPAATPAACATTVVALAGTGATTVAALAGSAAAPTPLAGSAAAPTPLAGGTAAPTPLAGSTAVPTPLAGGTAAPTPLAGSSAAPTPLASSAAAPTPLADGTAVPTPLAGGEAVPAPLAGGEAVAALAGSNAVAALAGSNAVPAVAGSNAIAALAGDGTGWRCSPVEPPRRR